MSGIFSQDSINVRESLNKLECLPEKVAQNSQGLLPIQGYTGKNLIINGNFLINQRGAGTYYNAAYTSDRWYQPLSGVDASPITNGNYPQINIANSNATQLIVRQGIELLDVGSYGYFEKGKIFTLSFKVYPTVDGCTGTFRIDFSDNIGNANAVPIVDFTVTKLLPVKKWTTITHTFVVDVDPLATSKQVNVTVGVHKVAGFNGSGINAVTDVQLERGPVATPFEAINYANELLKCQRYYVQFKVPTYMIRWAGSTAANYELFTQTLPTTMRTDPTTTILTNPSPTGFAIGTIQFFSNLRVCTLKATPSGVGAFGIANDGVYALDAEL